MMPGSRAYGILNKEMGSTLDNRRMTLSVGQTLGAPGDVTEFDTRSDPRTHWNLEK